MPEVALLPVSPAVEPAVLALNNAHAAELSWLDRDRLTLLLRQALPAPVPAGSVVYTPPATTTVYTTR
jgi:predicted GNAT superfamily acetyltransferase